MGISDRIVEMKVNYKMQEEDYIGTIAKKTQQTLFLQMFILFFCIIVQQGFTLFFAVIGYFISFLGLHGSFKLNPKEVNIFMYFEAFLFGGLSISILYQVLATEACFRGEYFSVGAFAQICFLQLFGIFSFIFGSLSSFIVLWWGWKLREEIYYKPKMLLQDNERSNSRTRDDQGSGAMKISGPVPTAYK